MRKTFFFAAVALALAACDKFHTSDNGCLDGFWQLTNVDTLANGRSADVRELGVFWAVQADLLEMRDTKDKHIDVFFRFDHSGNSLTLSSPVADDRFVSDSIITDVNTIRFYGLSHLTETLKVLQLSHEKMTLESELLRLYFRKY